MFKKKLELTQCHIWTSFTAMSDDPARTDRYYNALVDEVTSDGQVMIHFVGFKTAEVTRLALLRDPLPEQPKSEDAEGSKSGLVARGACTDREGR